MTVNKFPRSSGVTTSCSLEGGCQRFGVTKISSAPSLQGTQRRNFLSKGW
jgi:hypothetical protein